ncbi:hypothetical protein M0N77_04085 [Psychrobacter sp. AH5]|uniref:hypothetical protein n=1 Tax=Psychrobacter sp. AH5 TaxID=2937433 RepID=UPI0033403690
MQNLKKTNHWLYQRHSDNDIDRARLIKKPLAALIIMLGGMSISGCEPADDVENNSSIIASEQRAQNLKVSADIEDKIINSYARVASKHAHICPKLIQKQLDNSVIERTAEVMIKDSCDYFLYPKIGEQIAVSLDNDQIEALLITPRTYNFANGGYEVTSYDKHVIRLAYNGAGYKPENFRYDVAITIE